MQAPVRPAPVFVLFLLFPSFGPALRAAPGDLVEFIPFAAIAPQDIAWDSDEGGYWVTTFLDNEIHRLDEDLRTELEPPIGSPVGPQGFTTGIAYDSVDRTLWVADAASSRIIEIEKDGTPTGRAFTAPVLPVVNPRGAPTIRGMDFDPAGDGGRGSLYLVESVGTLIYEVGLDGTLLRTIEHPDDPDGFPGRGASAGAAGIALVRENGRIAAIYLTGVSGGRRRIVRLDPDGAYTGRFALVQDAGGNVTGIVRRPYRVSPEGPEIDAWICVVESTGQLAILEGGESSLPELFGLQCREVAREAELRWESRAVYDRIEIARGCDVVATLPGDADSWKGPLEDGPHALRVRAVKGAETTETAECPIVIGPGAVLDFRPLEGAEFPIDLARMPGGLLLVSEGLRREVHVLDENLNPVGSVPVDALGAEEGDVFTGIAAGPDGDTFFLFNLSQALVYRVNTSGELLDVFHPELPDLEESPEEEDFGVVPAMTFDPAGDGGSGSLWLIETDQDRVYEFALDGRLLRAFPHPYRAYEEPPDGSPFGSSSGGIALAGPSELLLVGGTLRERLQARFVRVRRSDGARIPGSEFSTAAIRREAGNRSLAFELLPGPNGARLIVLALAGSDSALYEVALVGAAVLPPTLLTARQVGFGELVELSFFNNGPYDSIEIFRDCELVRSIGGDAEGFLDFRVEPGLHTYQIRGIKAGVPSAPAETALRVGVGALLSAHFTWPARSPQQLARDPADGSYYVAVNWPGDEQTLFHFDPGFRFLGRRPTSLEPPWAIASVAVRVDEARKRWIYLIAWEQPVQLGQAGRETFRLVRESIDGLETESVEIDPPRPQNGFVTFPTGLVWYAPSDTFFYLERNSDTIIEMDPSGRTLRTIPHPAPPFQNFVFNLGMAAVPRRGTLLLAAAGRWDERVTRIVEMRLDGTLTGREIPLDAVPHRVTGMALVGSELVTVGTAVYSEFLRIQAAELGFSGFVRGDANMTRIVDLSDAITILSHLFFGGGPLQCADAADADDDGTVTLTDAVYVLLHLFLGGPPPPPPYPIEGADPTPDALGCGEL